ncbi:hypothetical protein AOX55_0000474 [Sinorhizobium fredii CCBAU 25509]|nr:hypothetical protein AOX55_0000474 [Sinorhizobium fredii CCBAU 25509]
MAQQGKVYAVADGLTLTRHALMRAQQRGIRRQVIDYVVAEADIDLNAGDGCHSYRISQRKMAVLRKAGIPAAGLDRAKRVVVICSEQSDEVVTVLHDHGRRGQRYRRQRPTWKSQ